MLAVADQPASVLVTAGPLGTLISFPDYTVTCENSIALFFQEIHHRTQESANVLTSARSGRATVAERA
jgi:hypothetical protein